MGLAINITSGPPEGADYCGGEHMKGRQAFFAIITVTLASVATIIFGEVIVRFFELGPQVYAVRDGTFRLSSDYQLGYELAPGAPDGDAVISSQGLRDREYAEIKPPSVFRIAVIGDSVAFGYGVQQREAMPKVLERLLNRHGSDKRYEVINFAVEGYSSTQVARRMVTTVSRFNPDLVVYLYCLNDPDSGFDDIVERLLAQTDSKKRGIVESQLLNARSLFSRLLIYHMATAVISNLGQPASNNVKYAEYGKGPSYPATLHADQGRWSNTIRDIGQIAAETRRIGADFVGVISPIMHRDGQAYRDNYPLDAVHVQIASAFRQFGAAVLDLAPEMSHLPESTQAAGIDMWHYSVIGNEFVASALSNFLDSSGFLPNMTKE
jgi:hypothetical protein